MRIRSLAPIAVAVALGASLVATPAQAAQTVTVKPETFAGGAAARALDVSILNQRVTLGDTVANIVKGVSNSGSTTLLAKAVGTGQLALLTSDTSAVSALTANGTTSAPKKCALDVPVLDVLHLETACGSSAASVNNDLLNAVATGEVGNLDLSVNNLLSQLGLNAATEPIGALATTLLSALPELPIDVGTTVNDLLTNVVNTKTLEVSIGDAESIVTSTANTVTATAHSAAVDIKILPLPTITVNGVSSIKSVPILEIIIGEAKATATYDRLTSKAVGRPTFDPALVRIKSSLPLLNLAGITSSPGFTIAPGQTFEIPGIAKIVVGAGKIVDDGEFGEKAVADGLSVELLGALNGGVVLNLAHAEAGAIDRPAQTKVLDVPSIDIARDIPTSLPRTGAETALPLALAGAAIAVVAIRRFRMVAAAK